jgi:anti-sigma factor ChrR (cupin superfamily)
MELNADFSQRVLLHADEIAWQASPMKGVARRMLDRIGDEVARATSIVRYDPGSRFSPHVHTGGEEFLVLDGVFEDEHGAFPAGCYIRNPPESRHTPGSTGGCILFVKLWQFDLADRTPVQIDINRIGCVSDAARPGAQVTPLFRDAREDVRIERWGNGAAVTLDTRGGAEILLLAGDCEQGGDALRTHSWLRLPDGPPATLRTGADGARAWIKTGHLRYAAAPAISGAH